MRAVAGLVLVGLYAWLWMHLRHAGRTKEQLLEREFAEMEAELTAELVEFTKGQS
jgi:hypothetical protein